MNSRPSSLVLRISLVVTLVTGLLAGAINFFHVKNKIERLRAELAAQTTVAQKAESELARTQGELAKTSVTLKVTKTDLDQTVSEKQAALASLSEQTSLAKKRGAELATLKPQFEDAQRYLERYRVAGLEPEQIVVAAGEIKRLQKALDAAEKNSARLAQQVKLLKPIDGTAPVILPAGLTARVLSTDPKWRFLVLDAGAEEGVLANGELLVRRGDKLVGKARISRVEQDRCIANLMSGWDLGDIQEGDVAIPATPQSGVIAQFIVK